jgi:hypothetical protein
MPEWECPECNEYNDDKEDVCLSCGEARPQVESTPEEKEYVEKVEQ